MHISVLNEEDIEWSFTLWEQNIPHVSRSYHTKLSTMCSSEEEINRFGGLGKLRSRMGVGVGNSIWTLFFVIPQKQKRQFHYRLFLWPTYHNVVRKIQKLPKQICRWCFLLNFQKNRWLSSKIWKHHLPLSIRFLFYGLTFVHISAQRVAWTDTMRTYEAFRVCSGWHATRNRVLCNYWEEGAERGCTTLSGGFGFVGETFLQPRPIAQPGSGIQTRAGPPDPDRLPPPWVGEFGRAGIFLWRAKLWPLRVTDKYAL